MHVCACMYMFIEPLWVSIQGNERASCDLPNVIYSMWRWASPVRTDRPLALGLCHAQCRLYLLEKSEGGAEVAGMEALYQLVMETR